MDLNKIATERRNARTMTLDRMTALEIAQAMNMEDAGVSAAIATVLPQIAKMIDAVADALSHGGRLFYLGAGTSGRIGVMDASECPPTFSVDPGMVIGIIAGGDGALRVSVEGAEDSLTLAGEDLVSHGLCARDVVIGIAASGRTPYVLGGLRYAKSLGCVTGAVACSADSEIGAVADIAMEAVVGPEVLTGSTRLKAGTAQKMILNMITTGAMVRTGKVYENLMVDLQPLNEKLVVRSQNIVMEACGVERETACKTLEAAGGCAKVAIVMLLENIGADDARAHLQRAGGKVREAVEYDRQEKKDERK